MKTSPIPLGPDNMQFYQEIVDAPFQDKLHSTSIALGVVVLLLADYENNALRRIALSNTEMADGAVNFSVKPFHEIVIPLNFESNVLIESLKSKIPQQTEDWAVMFSPELTPEEARFNQAGAGIACSVIYPLLTEASETPLGALIFSYFEPLDHIDEAHHEFMKEYSNSVALKISTKFS